jgi:potassium voltage-gated channel Eag-related subfamily H protein 7
MGKGTGKGAGGQVTNEDGVVGTASPSKPDYAAFQIISPTTPWMRKWDLFMVVLLGFCAIVTPWEVAFLEPEINGLYWINRLVDIGFVADMVINFMLAYYDNEAALFIWDQDKITKHYLTGWFSIDLVSIFPFDSMGMMMNSGAVSQLKVLRVVRLLRLIKLLRIFKTSRIFGRIQNELGISFQTWALCKFMGAIIISIHWVSCFWMMGPSFIDTGDETWVTAAGMSDANHFELYIACFEFGMGVLVMGYGEIVPANPGERVIALLCMFFCGCLYAYTVGEICGLVAQGDPATTEYNQNMDMLNSYMEEIKVPQSMRIRMREFFMHCKGTFRMKYYTDILELLSPQLQGEFAAFQHGSWLNSIPFFACDDDEERGNFITRIALKLEPRSFAPNEMIFLANEESDSMYIMVRGVAALLGRVLGGGKYFGQEVILKDSCRPADCRALTFVDVYALSQEDLYEIVDCGSFPSTQKLVRMAAIRLALKNKFFAILTLFRVKRGLKKTPPEELAAWKEEMKMKKYVKQDKLTRSGIKTKTADEREAEKKARELAQQHAEEEAALAKYLGGVSEEGEDADAGNDEGSNHGVGGGQISGALQKRVVKMERSLDALTKIVREGFETMEAAQEVAYRAFYNSQKSKGSSGKQKQSLPGSIE